MMLMMQWHGVFLLINYSAAYIASYSYIPPTIIETQHICCKKFPFYLQPKKSFKNCTAGFTMLEKTSSSDKNE